MKSKRAKEKLFAATDWFEEINMDLAYRDGAEAAIEIAEQEAEERCKNTFCQVLHELVMNKLDGANAVERYEQLLNGEQRDE